MYAVDDMTIFVRVVERASLSAAGRELRLSPAVVSSRNSSFLDLDRVDNLLKAHN